MSSVDPKSLRSASCIPDQWRAVPAVEIRARGAHHSTAVIQNVHLSLGARLATSYSRAPLGLIK